MAAMVGLNILYNCFSQVHVSEVRKLAESGGIYRRCAESAEFENGHIKGAHNIPLSQLRQRMDEIPEIFPYICTADPASAVITQSGALQGNGYTNVSNISGSFLGICLYEYFNDKSENRSPIVDRYNFN